MLFGTSPFARVHALGFAALTALAGCSQGPHSSVTDHVASDTELGSIGLGLTLPDGTSVDEVTYSITHDGVEVRSGVAAIDLTGHATAFVGNLTAGSGYHVVLRASRGDAGPDCVGEANFTVLAHVTINVDVVLSCGDTDNTGTVVINGRLNVCPRFLYATLSPSTQVVGSSIAISALADDRDGPSPVTLAWTAVDGSFSSPTSANTTYTCAAAGTKALRLSVSDGDCVRFKEYSVVCLADGDAGNLPASDAAANSDAGVHADAGDAGIEDASSDDASSGDAGDAAIGDAGTADAGSDAGPSIDGGAVDSGVVADAGADTGTVVIIVTPNICPALGPGSLSPSSQAVGGFVTLNQPATDANPSDVLVFTWTSTTDGTFSSPNTPRTTYTCVSAGPKTLRMTVSDGQCARSRTYPVTCL